MEDKKFDITKYTGTWYELMHYGSDKVWFQTNDNYNTTATYDMISGDTMTVVNTTWAAGKQYISRGKGRYLGGSNFRVDFPEMEVRMLEMTRRFGIKPQEEMFESSRPNYIIRGIMYDSNGDYMFSIVTNMDDSMLWVLSRTPNPPKFHYDILMEYMSDNFDRKKIVQTPHFK